MEDVCDRFLTRKQYGKSEIGIVPVSQKLLTGSNAKRCELKSRTLREAKANEVSTRPGESGKQYIYIVGSRERKEKEKEDTHST
jgi:hypothetical protein